MLDNTDIETRVMERVRANAGSGIWPHSRPNQYFIFCVGQDPIKINAFMSWAYHNDISIKPLVGHYNGQPERSFIVDQKNYDAIRPWLKNEESVLLIGRVGRSGNPTAVLYYLKTDQEIDLGELRHVSREEAHSRPSWSYDPLTKCYFVTDR